MRKLILYKGILPNADNSVYLCKTRNELINYLEPYKISEIELDNYRINAGIIKVAVNNLSLNDFNYDNVSYVIDYDSIGGSVGPHRYITYFRAYHVEKATLQSGMAIYNVTIDNWATYYNDFKDIPLVVTKCNRNVGLGVYDPIQVTSERDAIALEGNIFSASENYDILFIANVVTAQRLDGKENVTGLFALSVNVKTLANLVTEAERNGRNDLELAVRIVSGITSISAGLDVSISKLYVVPHNVIRVSEYGYEFNAKTPYTTNRTLTFNAFIINPHKEEKYITLPTLDLNKKYLIGTLTEGLEIPTYTKPVNIHYTFISGFNNLQVIVGVGDIEKDITASFDFGIIGSAQEQNTLENMGSALSGLSKVLKMSFGAFNSKNPIFDGVTSGLDFAGNIYNKVDAKGSVPNGNASTNFLYLQTLGGTSNVINPYLLTYFIGVEEDNYKRALLFGASFDDVLSIEEVFNFNYITDADTIEYTYLQGVVSVLNNIPKNAQIEIINKIRNGIYIQQWLKSITATKTAYAH